MITHMTNLPNFNRPLFTIHVGDRSNTRVKVYVRSVYVWRDIRDVFFPWEEVFIFLDGSYPGWLGGALVWFGGGGGYSGVGVG